MEQYISWIGDVRQEKYWRLNSFVCQIHLCWGQTNTIYCDFNIMMLMLVLRMIRWEMCEWEEDCNLIRPVGVSALVIIIFILIMMMIVIVMVMVMTMIIAMMKQIMSD